MLLRCCCRSCRGVPSVERRLTKRGLQQRPPDIQRARQGRTQSAPNDTAYYVALGSRTGLSHW
eukprot:8197180-Alexandrium_andersonii.AAC.1